MILPMRGWHSCRVMRLLILDCVGCRYRAESACLKKSDDKPAIDTSSIAGKMRMMIYGFGVAVSVPANCVALADVAVARAPAVPVRIIAFVAVWLALIAVAFIAVARAAGAVAPTFG